MAVPHQVKAAAPAARRAGLFALLALVLLIVGAAWVTHGFTRLPKLGNQWVDEHFEDIYFDHKG